LSPWGEWALSRPCKSVLYRGYPSARLFLSALRVGASANEWITCPRQIPNRESARERKRERRDCGQLGDAPKTKAGSSEEPA